jgi:hypothetical protein
MFFRSFTASSARASVATFINDACGKFHTVAKAHAR